MDTLKNKDTFEKIFNVALIGLAVISTEGKIIKVNKHFAKTLGYTEEKLNTLYLENLCLDAEYVKIKEKIKQILEGKISDFSVTINLLKADGTYCLVNIKTSPLVDESCNIENIIIVAKNITKQAKFESELRSEKTIVEAMMENLPDAVFFKDLNGKFVKVNKALLIKHGFKNESEIIGKTDFDLFSYSNASKAFLDEQKVIKTQEIFEGFKEKEEWLDGRVTWSLTTRLPLVEEGNVIGTFGISKNVTEIVLAEEKVKKTLEELEMVNANKDKFFSIISHDLKSPFNGLLGISEMLESDFDELSKDEVKEMVSVMKNLSFSVYALLESLLQWAQTQTGKMEYEFEKLDMFEMGNSIIELLAVNATNKNILLKNNIAENTFVFADNNAISTVVRNLVSNAIKFTKPDGVIKIEAETIRDKIVISVSDTGIGMSKENMNKLFKIEFNHTTVGTNDETGSGIGLILCKELVKKHNGKIWLESVLGVGSKFSFSLPIYKDN